MKIEYHEKQSKIADNSPFHLADQTHLRDEVIVKLDEKNSQHQQHHLSSKGMKFFLNLYSNTIQEQTPSLIDNLVLLLQIVHLSTVQYLNDTSVYNNLDINHNKSYLYIGLALFSLGFLCLFLITLFDCIKVQRYKDAQVVLFYLTVGIQILSILYYLFWILWVQQSSTKSIQWLTYDLTALFLYYYTLRQSIIKYYFQDWFIFIMIMESIALTILENQYFYYGVGQLLIILTLLFLYVFIIPYYKINKTNSSQKLTNTNKRKDRKTNSFHSSINASEGATVMHEAKQIDEKFKKFQSLTQGLKSLENYSNKENLKKMITKEATHTNGTNFRINGSSYLVNNKFSHQQMPSNAYATRQYSQQSFSISMEGSNNCLNSVSPKNQKLSNEVGIQKILNQTPFFEDISNNQKMKYSSSNTYTLIQNEISSLDAATKNGNAKLISSSKQQNNLTFNMDKNYTNGLTNSILTDSTPIKSFTLINMSKQNNKSKKGCQTPILQKENSNNNNDTKENKKNNAFLTTTFTKQPWECQKSESQKKLQYSSSNFLQQIQQVPVVDTYPIISFDKDLNIIHYSTNLIEQLTSQNIMIDGTDQLRSNTQRNIDIKRSQINSERFQRGLSACNEAIIQENSKQEYQNNAFLLLQKIDNNKPQIQNNNFVNSKKSSSFFKTSKGLHNKCLKDLRFFMETTYVQIIEFYETTKKRELISSFLNHDIQNLKGGNASQKLTHPTIIIDRGGSQTKQNSQDIRQQQTKTHLPENNQPKSTKLTKEEGTKSLSKQTTTLQSRSSYSFINSPALQGYRKAAMQSLSSNPQFLINLNSNSSLSALKQGATDLIITEMFTPSNEQKANPLPKSTISGSKSELTLQNEKEEIKNMIQTLNYIPQEFANDDHHHPTKSRQSSPTKLQTQSISQKPLFQQLQSIKRQSVPSINRITVPSQIQNGPSITSIKTENVLSQKPQEEFVQNIYQFERPCFQNSLQKILESILELEKDNNDKQVIYRIMKGAQIQFIPKCPNCELLKNQNKQSNQCKSNQQIKSSSSGGGILNHRKMSDNFNCSVKRFNLDNMSIDIIVNPMKNEWIMSPSKNIQVTNMYSFSSEKIRLVFRRDFAANFFENVYFIHSLQEEQNRSKADVLLVKKLFIDSFQSVSHEFGTALNCINNLSEVAESHMNESDVTQLIRPIRYNSTLIQFLINDILDHHMILQNTFVLQVERFSLQKLKEEMLELFKLQVEYKNLKFEIFIDSQLPEYLFQDKNRIQSILMTMIRNAIKYTQKGAICVELRLQAIYSNNPTTPKTANSYNLTQANYTQKIFLLSIKVRDTGVGLDEEESKKLKHLLNYGFCNEQISKNSLGNGIGGLCVSNLIAIKLSGRENLGIKFEKNYDGPSGTVFKFFVECQAFTKQRIGTSKIQNQTIIANELSHHLPTIQDDATIYDHNLCDSSLMHNLPSSSRINSPNELPGLPKTISVNPLAQQLNFSPQNQQITHTLQYQNMSISRNTTYVHQLNSSTGYNQMINQQSGNGYYTNPAIANYTITQIMNNQQSQAVPNSLNSSFNTYNGNQNFNSNQYFELQNEEYQVENLIKNMLFLRTGGASGSQNLQQPDEQDPNESFNKILMTQNQLNGSVSPLQIICGKKSHFNIIPKTPKNRATFIETNPQNQINSSVSQNKQQGVQYSLKSFTNHLQSQQQIQQVVNNTKLPTKVDIQETQQVNLNRKKTDLCKNVQDATSLANIKQESYKNDSLYDIEIFPKKQEHASRLDSLRPKIQLNTKQQESIITPQFTKNMGFFQEDDQGDQNQNPLIIKNQESIIKRTSSMKRPYTNSNGSTNSFINRNTRLTFGQEDDSIVLNRERSHRSSDFTQPPNLQLLKFQQSLNKNNISASFQQIQQESPKTHYNDIIINKQGESSPSNFQLHSPLVKSILNQQEILEETDSKVDNSTDAGYNKNNSYDIEIADERQENDVEHTIEGYNTFNEKWATFNKLSSTCCVKILCVDDEPFNHFVIKQLLKTKQLSCDTALNGEEGLQKFKQRKKCLSCGLHSYNLIIMDLNMPVKNGFETTMDIKQHAKQHFLNKVTVITCSAFIDIASKIKAQQSGSDFFIHKPINQSAFFELLQSQFQI